MESNMVLFLTVYMGYIYLFINILRYMDIHFISIAATQDIYLDIWRNIKNQPS